MASWVITGVSKGLGWEFLNQISANPDNKVIGIIRNKAPTAKRVAEELSDRKNITLLEADLTKYSAVKKIAEEASEILGGKLDYLLSNAGYVTTFDSYGPISSLGNDPEGIDREFHAVMDINVLANIHLYNLFMPLILKGSVKKVVNVSSAMADIDWVRNYGLATGSIYATSKLAMNMINAKFSAEYAKDGVLFVGFCPGLVDVGHFDNATPEQQEGLGSMIKIFQEYSANFKGANTPAVAIKQFLDNIENATVEKNAGDFLSQFGNKQWL